MTAVLISLAMICVSFSGAIGEGRRATGDGQTLHPKPHTLNPQTPNPEPSSFLSGGDVSEIPQIEDEGGKFFWNGKREDPFVIMRKAGWNWVRFRIWNKPIDGYCDVPHTLALAKRAAAQGLKISLDFHYSDWWADPAKQNKPAAWKDLSFAALNKEVYRFTYDTVRAMIAQGTPPNMVQVGNEIIGGMLWPEGKVNSNEPESWKRFAILLKAGLRAVREAGMGIGENGKNGESGPEQFSPSSPPSRILTMLHIDRGGDNAASVWWLDHVVKEGVEFDCIGQSYYPFWHGTLAQLEFNLNDLAKRYRKDVFVVETAYPWTMDHKRRSLMNEKDKLTPGFPATPEGQAAFLKKVTEILKAVPGGRGKGLLYWAPTYLLTPKNKDRYPYENLATFDTAGNALAGVKALGVGR